MQLSLARGRRGGSAMQNLLKLSPPRSTFPCICIHLCDERIWVRSQSWLKVLYWAVLGVFSEPAQLQSGGLSEISNGIAARYSTAISYLKHTGCKSFLVFFAAVKGWIFFNTSTLKRVMGGLRLWCCWRNVTQEWCNRITNGCTETDLQI